MELQCFQVSTTSSFACFKGCWNLYSAPLVNFVADSFLEGQQVVPPVCREDLHRHWLHDGEKECQKKKLNPIQTSPENPLEMKKPAVWNLVAHLQQVAPLVHLLDVFVGEDAAGSLQLALSLSRSSGDDGLVQTAHRQGATTTTMIR